LPGGPSNWPRRKNILQNPAPGGVLAAEDGGESWSNKKSKGLSVDIGRLVLIAGATGYVGGCLAPRLLERGYRVRVLARDPRLLSGRLWLPQVEVVQGDLFSPELIDKAMQGVSAAYYLVHNMASGRNYFEREMDAARNFASAAGAAGVEHIIYLGGLADPHEDISLHMRSRIQTGDILREGCVPVTEFRASLVIGSGSISFEMIRYLTEQFPILVGPRWMYNHTQPVAIQDVLEYLLSALETPACRGNIYEIGGKDRLTYAETMSIYARLRGLKRRAMALPGIPVDLMAAVAGLLTPVPTSIARPLLGGMRTDSVVHAHLADRDFPRITPMGYETAVSLALDRLSPGCLEFTRENGAASFRIKREGFFVEGKRIRLQVRPRSAYRAVTGLGGKRGWLYLDGLWKLRGFFDRLVGGPGLRGRGSETDLLKGDVLDFYRVEALEQDRLVRLRAELKAPGLGWMEWRIEPHSEKELSLAQIAYFAPKGMPGFLYWVVLLPVHRLVFAGLMKALARRAGEIQNSIRKR
jgi:uncharacterized protein YbjT (DUF2867 family)